MHQVPILGHGIARKQRVLRKIGSSNAFQKLNRPVSSRPRGPAPSAVCNAAIDPKPSESTRMLDGS